MAELNARDVCNDLIFATHRVEQALSNTIMQNYMRWKADEKSV